MKYENITLEECFIKYHNEKICCICDADKKEVIFEKE